MLARMARVILQVQLVVRLWMTPLQLARLRLAHHRPSRRLQQRLASGVVLCCLGWLMLARMARVLWLLMVQLQVVVWPLTMRLQLAQQTLVQAQARVRPGAQGGVVLCCLGWLMLVRMAQVSWLLVMQLQVVVWHRMMRLQLARLQVVQVQVAQAWVRLGARAEAACSGGPGSRSREPL